MTPEEQIEQVRSLSRAAVFAVDAFVMDNWSALENQVTAAARTDLIVQAAVGYLVGAGLVVPVPEDETPEWLPMGLEPHLLPDVAAAVAEFARIQGALR